MTTGFPELQPGEVLIPPGPGLVLRNVNPAFVDPEAGLVTSQAFAPNSGDDGCMSVVQESKSKPLDAFVEYTTKFGRQSAGVWGLATADVDNVGGRTVDDEATAPAKGFDLPVGHAFVDFRDLGGVRNQESKRAKKLRTLAVARGCLYLNSDRAAG